MTVFDPYIVVSPSYIKLGEDLSISQFIYEVGDEGKGVGVTDGVFVFSFPVVVGVEMLVRDGINSGVSWGSDKGSDKMGFMLFGISGEGTEEFL